MAIEVHCDCGRVYSVGPELSGKKIRCKKCAIVLKVPVIPLGESLEAAPPSNEWEPVKDDAVICKTCGSPAKPKDDVCLSCGASLGNASSAPMVPRVALLVGLGVVALAVVVVVGMKLYSSSHLNGLLVQGREKLERGEMRAAKEAFEEVLKTNKDSVPALEGLVQCGVASSDWRLVRQWGPQLVGKLPKGEKRGKAKLDLARAQLETGDFTSAERSAREAKDEDGGLDGTEEIVGLALLGAKQIAKAEEALKKALEAGSKDARVALGMAKICEDKNAIKEARTWADKAAEGATKDEKGATIWLECARLRERDGDLPAALNAIQSACDADPKSGSARTKLALAYLDAKRPQEALSTAKEAKTLAPEDALTARALGEALLVTGDNAGAKTELERSEKLGPEDAETTFLLGKAYLRLGEKPIGVEKLEKALKKLDKDASFAIEAGRTILATDGPADKAYGILDAAVRLEPKEATVQSKKVFADCRILLARAAARVDRARNANRIVDALTKAMDMDPSRRDVFLDLAQHYLENDNNAKAALPVLEKGLAFHGEDEEMLYQAGVTAMKVGGKSYKAAVEHLKKLEQKNPDYKDVKQKRGAAESGLQFEGE